MTPLLTIFLLFFLVSCSKTTDFDALQKKSDIYYDIYSKKPFSGLVIKKYETGQNQMKGSLLYGKEDGIVTKWYENGQKEYQGNFKDGQRDGRSTSWFKNGKIKGQGDFNNGRQDGICDNKLE